MDQVIIVYFPKQNKVINLKIIVIGQVEVKSPKNNQKKVNFMKNNKFKRRENHLMTKETLLKLLLLILQKILRTFPSFVSISIKLFKLDSC